MATKTREAQTDYPATGMAKVSLAAKFLSVSQSSVRVLFDSGVIKGRRVGAHRQLSWESLHQFARGK